MTPDRYRSAVTGEYVTEEFAQAHPNTTVKEEDIPTSLARIEGKLDSLIAALADDDDGQEPERTLDGDETDGERDQGQSLG